MLKLNEDVRLIHSAEKIKTVLTKLSEGNPRWREADVNCCGGCWACCAGLLL